VDVARGTSGKSGKTLKQAGRDSPGGGAPGWPGMYFMYSRRYRAPNRAQALAASTSWSAIVGVGCTNAGQYRHPAAGGPSALQPVAAAGQALNRPKTSKQDLTTQQMEPTIGPWTRLPGRVEPARTSKTLKGGPYRRANLGKGPGGGLQRLANGPVDGRQDWLARRWC
jgi:hypothetical protein